MPIVERLRDTSFRLQDEPASAPLKIALKPFHFFGAIAGVLAPLRGLRPPVVITFIEAGCACRPPCWPPPSRSSRF